MKRRLDAMLFALRHLGLLGWVGVTLALATAAYAVIIVPQQAEEISAARAETARLQQRRLAMEKTPGVSADANSPAKSAADLPTLKTAPVALRNLENIAREDKLQLKRNEYRYVDHVEHAEHLDRMTSASAKKAAPPAEKDPVVEVRIAIPSSGKYGSIRAFIAHAMDNLPTLVLDGMSLKRESIAQGDIQAQLRFTLFVRRDS